ncbi:MAG: PKD domain-containing protein [Bacilli bacterium]
MGLTPRRGLVALLLALLLIIPAAALIPPLDQLPEGSVPLADGTVRLPDGSILLPDPIPTPLPLRSLEGTSSPSYSLMGMRSDPTQNLMIYWEDSCDSLADWTYLVTDPNELNQWAVSPDYNVTDPILGSPNGIGHPYYDKFQSGRLTRTIPLPKASSPVKAKYLDFWYKFDASSDSGNAAFYVNGVDIVDTPEWYPRGHQGQWVHVQYPCDHLSGKIEFEVLLQPNTGYPARLMFDQIQVYAEPIAPSFTASPTAGDQPLTVKFTDTTRWSDGNIVAWYWDFGDGGTSPQQHPSHTYSYAGTAYDVHLTTTTRWGESNVTNYPAYIAVGTVAEGDFTVDFTATPTNGTSPLTVQFTASVSPATTDITNWKWNFGDAGTEPQAFGQTVSHTYNTYASNAVFDVTLTGFASGSGTVNTTTKAGYITVNGSGGSGGVASLSTVKVRFVVLDYVGQRFGNVTVTATPLESTGPWAWLEDLLGVPGEVDVKNEVLTGTTGTDGGIVFTMVESVKYRVDITDASQGISTSITIYPKEDEIPVYIWPATTPPLGETVDYDLTATALDDENTRLTLTYRDGLANTTSVRFYVRTEAGEYVHTETGKGNVTLSYEMPNEPGEVYIFGFEAQHGVYGLITKDQFVRFESNRPKVDFAPWIPLWVYNWAAIGFIVCIAAIFGFQTLKFGVVLVPVFALLFTYMEWLDTPVLLTLCAMTLGILLYMRYSEGETGA